MRYSFHPEAENELLSAITYFEDCSEGLGLDFAKEVFATIQRTLRFPYAWTEFSYHTRRALTKRFPFGVIYQVINDEEIVILAVMQLNREPNYWTTRTN